MFEYLVLTDGTTIVDFTDGISYDLVSYAPVVAPRNDNELGPLYADVEETIVFHAIGCTAAEAYGAARAVNMLLDQAARWWLGENVSAVTLLVKAQGSQLEPLQVAVQGRASGGPPNLALPAKWDMPIQKYVIQNTEIRFVRRGQLLIPTAETTSASGSATNPTVQSVTFASALSLSAPLKLSYSFSALGDTLLAVVLTARATNRLQIYEAEGATFVSPFSSVADGANNARGGNVLRYTPPSTFGHTFTLSLSGFDSASRRLAIWAAVRNNSATTGFVIQCANGDEGPSALRGGVVIEANSLVPQIVFLGLLGSRAAFTTLAFKIIASAAAGTLDIDYIVVQAVDDETSSAVIVYDSSPALLASPLVLDGAPLSEASPLVTAFAKPKGYAGDPRLFTRGDTVAAAILATSNASWRATALIGGALVTTAITASRNTAYLIPE